MPRPHQESDPVEVYQLRIRLLTISPMISRRIRVRSDSSIAELHETIQCIMGWSNEHLHRFAIRGVHYGANYLNGLGFIDDGRKVLLRDFNFRERERFLYEYDMFDSWRHEIRVEKRLPLDTTQQQPTCISGRGKTPPEDCGGPDQFMALRDHYHKFRVLSWMAELLAPILEDGDVSINRSELRQAMYWLEIDKFDHHKANQRLADHRAGNPYVYTILGG
jgi:hypothetical protein